MPEIYRELLHHLLLLRGALLLVKAKNASTSVDTRSIA
jgi:hypothetical protein